MSHGDRMYYCKNCSGNLKDTKDSYCSEECKEAMIEYGLCECGCGTTMMKTYFRNSGSIGSKRTRRFLPNHILSSSVGSTNHICEICKRGYSSIKSYYRHIDENRCLDKEAMERFKLEWNRLCHCGCGNKVLPGRSGLSGHLANEPWNKGLTKEDNAQLQKTSERRLKEMEDFPYKSGVGMTHTSIEMKVKGFLDTLDIESFHQFSFFYKFITDFAIVSKKLIIECDGNYWHDYPYGTLKDKERDKFIISKNWKIIRFWESDINKNFEMVQQKIIEAIAL